VRLLSILNLDSRWLHYWTEVLQPDADRFRREQDQIRQRQACVAARSASMREILRQDKSA
jgi:hypothetical protein